MYYSHRNTSLWSWISGLPWTHLQFLRSFPKSDMFYFHSVVILEYVDHFNCNMEGQFKCFCENIFLLFNKWAGVERHGVAWWLFIFKISKKNSCKTTQCFCKQFYSQHKGNGNSTLFLNYLKYLIETKTNSWSHIYSDKFIKTDQVRMK